MLSLQVHAVPGSLLYKVFPGRMRRSVHRLQPSDLTTSELSDSSPPLGRLAVLLNCGAKVRPFFHPSKLFTAILFAILCYGILIINGLRLHRAHREDRGHRDSPKNGHFLPQKTQKNRISAVFFNHCYSNCYSILKMKRLRRFNIYL